MSLKAVVPSRPLTGLALILALVVAAGAGSPTVARTPAASPAPLETGRMIAERDCSSCHAIGPTGESPLEGAPRWRDLHTRFPVDDLAEALAEGISVGHQGMPDNPYEPADVQALIAYLKSLETPDAVAPRR